MHVRGGNTFPVPTSARLAASAAPPIWRGMIRILDLLLLLAAGAARAQPFAVSDFASGLNLPWGAAFLPAGRLLVIKRPGRLVIRGLDGQAAPPLSGLPQVEALALG